MRIRTRYFVLWTCLLFIFISCETEVSEKDNKNGQKLHSSDDAAFVDTNKRDQVDDIPMIQTPGAQIDREKVAALLEEVDLSFRDIVPVDGTKEDFEKSIEKLKQLLDSEEVSNDEELEFMVHAMLGNSNFYLYEKTENNDHLNKAKNHLDTAIAIFENQSDYKVDLAGPYRARIGVYLSKEEYEKAISQIQYLIEEFQDIGYGPYKNWFAANQVQWLHSLTRQGYLTSDKEREIIDYLRKISDKYDNEVGITARMVLALHFANEDKSEEVDRLIKSIEKTVASLDNDDFEEDKWRRVKTKITSIQKRNAQPAGQQSDTLFYNIDSDMIAQERIVESEREATEYRVLIKLKKDHQTEFAELTAENIGNFLAVVHEGEILSPVLPTIQTGIPDGGFQIGPFKTEAKAQEVVQDIFNKDS